MPSSREGPERPGRQKGQESESEIPRHTSPAPPHFSILQTLTSHLQGDLSAAPQGGQAGVVDSAGIAGPMLLTGDRGRLQVCGEAQRAV